MWKKALLIFTLFAFTIAVNIPADTADAARKSFSSGKKSFSQTPKKAQTPQDNVSKSQSGTTKTGSTAGTATTQNRGFFSGGSLMKGLMIGGIAGLLFGSLFSGWGGFGDFIGLLVNVLAIIVLIAVVRAAFNAFRRNRDRQRPNPNDSRRW